MREVELYFSSYTVIYSFIKEQQAQFYQGNETTISSPSNNHLCDLDIWHPWLVISPWESGNNLSVALETKTKSATSRILSPIIETKIPAAVSPQHWVRPSIKLESKRGSWQYVCWQIVATAMNDTSRSIRVTSGQMLSDFHDCCISMDSILHSVESREMCYNLTAGDIDLNENSVYTLHMWTVNTYANGK